MGFLFGVITSSPMEPLSPICEGGFTPGGRSVAGTSRRPERRRTSVSWTLPSRVSDTHARAPGLGAGNLDVQSGGPVLTRVELGVVLPGPALKQGAVHDQPGGGDQVLHGGHAAFQGVGDQGRVCGDDPGSGGLRDAVASARSSWGRLCLKQVRGRRTHRYSPSARAPNAGKSGLTA